MSTAKGCWQSAGTLIITAKGKDDLFVSKDMAFFFGDSFVTNSATTGSTIEIRQALSILTKDLDGSLLHNPKAGSCKVAKTSRAYFTLQDAQLNDNGDVLYKFLVTGSKTPEGLLAGRSCRFPRELVRRWRGRLREG